MKLDKETVVKHQFWFMLGGFALLWLIAITSLKLLAAGPIAAKKTAYEKSAGELKSAQSKKPKNPDTFLPPWKKNADLFRSKRDEIWSAAFELQTKGEPFETWPAVGQMPQLLYPEDTDKSGQPIPSGVDRQEYKDKGYAEQFEGLEKIVAPVELLGGVAGVMEPQQWARTPSREECWLAQEDLWVRRELLRVVKDACDRVARFQPEEVKPNEKLPEGVPAGAKHRRYRNYNWQMDLFITTKDGRPVLHEKSRLTNVHRARRTLPLAVDGKSIGFLLKQPNREPYKLVVNGESVAPDAFQELKEPRKSDTIDFNRDFDVDEVFVWETCPVKRIDTIKAPYQSHRTFAMTLKAKEALKKLDPDSAPAEGTDTSGTPSPGGPSMPPGGPTSMGGPPAMGSGGGNVGVQGSGAGMGKLPGMDGRMGMGMGASGGTGQPPDPTPRNGIDRVRYLNVTDQCRHLPFGMVLVVDQAHIPEVELAMSNSRLRIQTTQVEFHHIPGIRPGDESGGGGGVPFMPGMPGRGGDRRTPMGPLAGGGPMMRPPGMMRGSGGVGVQGGGAGAPMMGRGGRGPMGPPAPGGTVGGDSGEEADPNLVELSVYGIAVLYERFPPKKKPEGTDPNNPGGTPAPTTPPAAANGATPPAPPAAAPGTPAAPMPPSAVAPAPADGPKPPAAPDKQPDGVKPAADDKKAPTPAAPPKG